MNFKKFLETIEFQEPHSELESEPNYVYHVTNIENAYDIANSGYIDVFKPWHGTEQDAWPDMSVEKRSYWSKNAGHVWSFAPSEGKPVILRTLYNPKKFKIENTGDIYSTKRIPSNEVEFLSKNGWNPLNHLTFSK
jgi:hypothetical protein